MVKITEIPQEFQYDNIRWLKLFRKNSSSPVFLFHYADISTSCRYDDFFLSVREAEEFAYSQYGVDSHSWRTKEYFKEQGIDIYSADEV